MSLPLLLVVDDAPEIVLIVQRLGKWAGHEVLDFADAPSAWQYLQLVAAAAKKRPDLVLVDLNLPGMSGLELCRRVRQTPALAELPVALFGSWERTGDVAAGLQAGMDFVLSKDLLSEPEAWHARIAEILQAPHGRPFLQSLSSLGEFAFPPQVEARLAAIEQALQHPSLRKLGWEVVRVLVHRAKQRVAPIPTAAVDEMVTEEGKFAPSLLARTCRPDHLRAFAAALAEQAWRLLGSAASEPFCVALNDALGSNAARMMTPVHAILLVEDNPADVVLTQRALQECGSLVQLIVVRDGQEAIDYLLRQGFHAADPAWRCPDLILLDLNLPRLTGLDVLKRLRATPELKSVPVVVLTTSRRREDVQELYAAGANTYIEKPQDFDRFVEVLQTIQRYWLDTALLPPPGK